MKHIIKQKSKTNKNRGKPLACSLAVLLLTQSLVPQSAYANRDYINYERLRSPASTIYNYHGKYYDNISSGSFNSEAVPVETLGISYMTDSGLSIGYTGALYKPSKIYEDYDAPGTAYNGTKTLLTRMILPDRNASSQYRLKSKIITNESELANYLQQAIPVIKDAEVSLRLTKSANDIAKLTAEFYNKPNIEVIQRDITYGEYKKLFEGETEIHLDKSFIYTPKTSLELPDTYPVSITAVIDKSRGYENYISFYDDIISNYYKPIITRPVNYDYNLDPTNPVSSLPVEVVLLEEEIPDSIRLATGENLKIKQQGSRYLLVDKTYLLEITNDGLKLLNDNLYELEQQEEAARVNILKKDSEQNLGKWFKDIKLYDTQATNTHTLLQ